MDTLELLLLSPSQYFDIRFTCQCFTCVSNTSETPGSTAIISGHMGLSPSHRINTSLLLWHSASTELQLAFK